MECDKYPYNFNGLSPEEFAKEFGNTNYSYQKECYNELREEYLKQSKVSKIRNKIQLSSGLEQLATALYLVNKAIEKVCNSCINYLKN